MGLGKHVDTDVCHAFDTLKSAREMRLYWLILFLFHSTNISWLSMEQVLKIYKFYVLHIILITCLWEKQKRHYPALRGISEICP